MVKRNASIQVVIVSAILLAQPAIVSAGSAPPIPLATVRQRGVVGALGIKLGTIVTVEGTAIPNKRRTKADIGIPFFLRIERVNDRPLKRAVEFGFTSTELKPPPIGAHFRYIAYETGAYVGIPHGLFKHVPAFTGVGYFFKTNLQIVKPVK